MEVLVDGVAVTVAAGATILEACDSAGRYVPRLCFYPGLTCCARSGLGGTECGLCVIRLSDGTVSLACTTEAVKGMEIATDDAGLRALRSDRLAQVLARHPHICLSCPDRDGCTRDQCTYGIPSEARCCAEFGRCELGKLAAHIDSGVGTRRGATSAPGAMGSVPREAVMEGRIRREPGLCIGCGRCVVVCEISPPAGRALGFIRPGVAGPRRGTLRDSGCTFCGRCVMVCPAGALTAPGDEGARWLASRREKNGLAAPTLPPQAWQAVTPEVIAQVSREAGVFQLVDADGKVLRIGGVADLQQGLTRALMEPACVAATRFCIELGLLFTQRESELLARYAQENGHLPPGNDLADDLFGDEPSAGDPWRA